MIAKLSTIGKWIGAAIAPLLSSLRHSWAYTHSTLEPTRTLSLSPEHSRPSLTAPNNLAPNQETPLNPQNQHRPRLRSPLPQRAYKREAKSAHRQQHYGL